MAVLVLVADPSAAEPFAPLILTLNGGTGELTAVRKRGLLGRVFGTR
jgi:hypothetical protein